MARSSVTLALALTLVFSSTGCVSQSEYQLKVDELLAATAEAGRLREELAATRGKVDLEQQRQRQLRQQLELCEQAREQLRRWPMLNRALDRQAEEVTQSGLSEPEQSDLVRMIDNARQQLDQAVATNDSEEIIAAARAVEQVPARIDRSFADRGLIVLSVYFEYDRKNEPAVEVYNAISGVLQVIRDRGLLRHLTAARALVYCCYKGGAEYGVDDADWLSQQRADGVCTVLDRYRQRISASLTRDISCLGRGMIVPQEELESIALSDLEEEEAATNRRVDLYLRFSAEAVLDEELVTAVHQAAARHSQPIPCLDRIDR